MGKFKTAAQEAAKKAAQVVKPVAKDIAEEAKKVGKEAAKQIAVNALGRIIKAIGNHPDWYKYDGKLSIPAYNEMRPFGTGFNDQWAEEPLYLPGAGVGHIIHNNVAIEDVSDEEYFNFASAELFRNMRANLRSNLTYKQDDVKEFMYVTYCITLAAVFAERTLGLYTKFIPEIPEFQAAVSSVTSNPNEDGNVLTRTIKMIDDYQDSITRYQKLASAVMDLPVSKKFIEYAQWWIGTIFTDQTRPNAQYYMNIPRRAPFFVITNEELEHTTVDYADLSIQDIYEQVILVLNRYGVIIADIEKCCNAGHLNIVDPTAYQPKQRVDEEFFTILINSYTYNSTDEDLRAENDNMLANFFKPEYIRIDVMSEIRPDNMVGVVNALAPWAGVKAPTHIISQALIVANKPEYLTPIAANIETAFDNIAYLYQLTGSDPDAILAFQWDSFYNETTFMELQNSGELSELKGSMSTRFPKNSSLPSGDYTAALVRIPAFNAITLSPVAVSDGVYTHSTLLAQFGQGTKYYLYTKFDTSTSKVTEIGIYAGTPSAIVVSSTAFPASALKLAGNMDGLIVALRSTVILTSPEIDPETPASASQLQSLYTMFTTPYVFSTWVPKNIAVEFTASFLTASFRYKESRGTDIALIIENVDYHVPIVRQNTATISFSNVFGEGESKRIEIEKMPVLLKEAYVPILLNKADIQAVTYWMFLGLFTHDVKRAKDSTK